MVYLCFERIQGLRGFISIQSQASSGSWGDEVLAFLFYFWRNEDQWWGGKTPSLTLAIFLQGFDISYQNKPILTNTYTFYSAINTHKTV
jgi:hypothetical protein